MECVMKKNEKALTVAFTGGGGKTSLILGLAEIFSGQGKRVQSLLRYRRFLRQLFR